MKLGDLIKFEPVADDSDDRRIGTVLKFDVFRPPSTESRTTCERIIEVLWNTGEASWILQERVEIINVND